MRWPGRLRLLTVGPVRAPHFKDALDDYCSRIRRFMAVEAESVAAVGLSSEKPAETVWAMKTEAERIFGRVPEGETMVALDKGGRSFSSEQLAAWLGERLGEGRGLCFIVGGAWGLDRTVLDRAAWTLSLGPLTLPHELCAVVLAEQVYRALTILSGTPYHK
jgi:23S rRNA (pseudouridine1915-N3)-methyltransferase